MAINRAEQEWPETMEVHKMICTHCNQPTHYLCEHDACRDCHAECRVCDERQVSGPRCPWCGETMPTTPALLTKPYCGVKCKASATEDGSRRDHFACYADDATKNERDAGIIRDPVNGWAIRND